MIHIGYVVKVHAARGFAFVGDAADGQEYFLHRSQIITPSKTIDEGTKVEFQLGMYAGRKVALQVKPVIETGASL